MYKKLIITIFSLSVCFTPPTLANKKSDKEVTRQKSLLETNSAKLMLDVRNQHIKLDIYNNNKKIIALTDIRFNDVKALHWIFKKSSENSVTLEGEFPAHVDFYNPVTNNEHRLATLVISKVDGGFRINAEPSWGRTTDLQFDYLGDHFFGLSEPLQPDGQLSPDLTGSSVNVDINSEDAYLHENYATAYSAFYMSSFGYGSFFDSFARGRYDLAINGKNRITHDTGNLDWYVFVGKDGVDIQRAYFSLIGSPKTVPAWGLGPMGWRDQNNGGAAEILDDVKKMRELRIPFTSWFVDRPYSDGAHAWSKMNFNSKFANPEQWIQQLRQQEGVEFMTWTATATFGDTSLGKHLTGSFSYIDLTDAKTVETFKKNLAEKQYAYGVKGHKMDRADEVFPIAEVWADKTVSIASRRNQYSYLMAKVHDQALRKQWGDDQMNFARSAYHRSQPYLSAIWAGDPRTSWEGLQSNYANAMRASFMGFPVWGTDVGGYQGDGYIPENLYIRWMQAGSMSGLFEIKLDGAGGSGRDRMPWQYDEKFQTLFRNICEDRMQFLPYLYSLANTSAVTGAMMQPLTYRHLQDKNTYTIADQFYLGSALLIAPVLDAGLKRTLYLPKGNWVDFNNTALRHLGGKTITVDAPLDKLPRFIAENSIFVQGDIYKGNNRNWNTQAPGLSIIASPAASQASTQFMYVDLLDANKQKLMRMERDKNGLSLHIPALKHAGELNVLLLKIPKAVELNGKPVAWAFDDKTKRIRLALKPAEDSTIKIQL